MNSTVRGPLLLDSNVYIRLFRARIDPIHYLLRYHDSTDLVVCGMVQVEVLRGLRHPKDRDRLASFFSLLQWVDTDQKVWDSATSLAWDLDRKGRPIPATDVLIAACALQIGATVYTFDTHFLGIEGLSVISDPIEE